MQIDLRILGTVGLCCLPVAIAIAILFRQRQRQREYSRSPFDELQRRPAGESLRRKLEELDDKINEQSTMLVLFPVLLAVGLFAQRPRGWLIPLTYLGMSAGTAAIFGSRLSRTLRERADYRIGFEGERFVGEELSHLKAQGFEIYHDVPFDGFNIDHVLVGARGVFVVETKTRRKPVNKHGKKQFRVQFDGKVLQWTWGSDSHGIEQAKNNGKTLAAWLRSATGDNVRVTPILTLPGWLVERKAPSDGLHVLNPKEIRQVCAAQPEKLDEAQIRRICHQLDQRCRIAIS